LGTARPASSTKAGQFDDIGADQRRSLLFKRETKRNELKARALQLTILTRESLRLSARRLAKVRADASVSEEGATQFSDLRLQQSSVWQAQRLVNSFQNKPLTLVALAISSDLASAPSTRCASAVGQKTNRRWTGLKWRLPGIIQNERVGYFRSRLRCVIHHSLGIRECSCEPRRRMRSIWPEFNRRVARCDPSRNAAVPNSESASSYHPGSAGSSGSRIGTSSSPVGGSSIGSLPGRSMGSLIGVSGPAGWGSGGSPGRRGPGFFGRIFP
jgi:hypothetical protein